MVYEVENGKKNNLNLTEYAFMLWYNSSSMTFQIFFSFV